MLVHPDKNPTMTDRASLAFEGKLTAIVSTTLRIIGIQSHQLVCSVLHYPPVSSRYLAINKAYKILEDEKERKKCVEVVEEARERVETMVSTAFRSRIASFIFLHVTNSTERERANDRDEPWGSA